MDRKVGAARSNQQAGEGWSGWRFRAGQGLSVPEGEGICISKSGRGAGGTKHGRGAGREVSGGVRGGCSSGTAGKGSRLEVGARVRTQNMYSMIVTLDVSRVSGWLKADAYCRVARWAYVPGGGGAARAGR